MRLAWLLAAVLVTAAPAARASADPFTVSADASWDGLSSLTLGEPDWGLTVLLEALGTGGLSPVLRFTPTHGGYVGVDAGAIDYLPTEIGPANVGDGFEAVALTFSRPVNNLALALRRFYPNEDSFLGESPPPGEPVQQYQERGFYQRVGIDTEPIPFLATQADGNYLLLIPGPVTALRLTGQGRVFLTDGGDFGVHAISFEPTPIPEPHTAVLLALALAALGRARLAARPRRP